MNEQKTAKIVNKAFAGEPQHICLQDVETNETFEFSQITNEAITDNDIEHPIVQNILQNGHVVNYIPTENSKITLIYE